MKHIFLIGMIVVQIVNAVYLHGSAKDLCTYNGCVYMGTKCICNVQILNGSVMCPDTSCKQDKCCYMGGKNHTIIWCDTC